MRTNIHDARGASRGKKTWAERRGPEPPAAVKDAFGAGLRPCFASLASLTASAGSGVGPPSASTATPGRSGPAPRRSRWSDAGPAQAVA